MGDLHAEEWPSAVTRYLVGKEQVFLGDVSKEALGMSYRDMSRDDWRRLAGIMTGAGWRWRTVIGARMWEPATGRMA